MIRVQAEAFDVGQELASLKGTRKDVGAFGLFVGSVRELSGGAQVSAMTLEHYPGMTEQALAEIESEARRRWSLQDVLIIHRFGRLEAGEDIVLVITASAHREAALEACAFLMDWLKTKAPFWKLEQGETGERWVGARATDEEAAKRWK
jgi:molybdopterin synthase catalytic subunit